MRVIQVRVVLGYVSVEPWDPTRRVFPLHHWQLEVVSWLSSYEKYQSSILVLS